MATRYIKSFASRFDEEANIQEGGLNRPYVAYLEDEQRIDWDHEPPEPDFSRNYFTVIVNEPGYLILTEYGSTGKTIKFDYSLDSGKTWVANGLAKGNAVHVTADTGATIWLRGNNSAGLSKAYNQYHYLTYSKSVAVLSGDLLPFNVEGNIMSLLKSSGFENELSLESYGTFTFCNLFQGSLIDSAENLVLPATTLTQACYRQLFYRSQLHVPPKTLPALNPKSECYYQMFYQTPITEGPVMELSTITAADNHCCYEMFRSCTNLLRSPIMKLDLSSNVNPNYPYHQMFYDCTKLNTVICLSDNPIPSPQTPLTANCDWFKNVPNTGGVFKVKQGTLSGWQSSPKGASGVPAYWTISEYTEG